MGSNSTASEFPNQFQRESLLLVSRLVELTSSVFYLVQPNMRSRGVALFNMNADVEREYRDEFIQLDPLNPSKFEDGSETVVTIDSQISSKLLKQSIYYQEFMKPHDHRYVADMFFRCDGHIIAVLSMLRSESMHAFSDDELALLRNIQPFLEYTLNTVYMPKRMAERQSMQEKYSLTGRELDVLELIMAGASNKFIASELAVGIATVKTHLQHLFKKLAVSSRTELLSRIIAELGP